MQEQLTFTFKSNDETPLHRERDRPPAIKFNHWSEFIDSVCIRGGVRLTHEALLRDFHRCCPHHAPIDEVTQLTVVHLIHWESYWRLWHPGAFR